MIALGYASQLVVDVGRQGASQRGKSRHPIPGDRVGRIGVRVGQMLLTG